MMNELERVHKICAECSGPIRLFVPMDRKNVRGCDMYLPKFGLMDNERMTETHRIFDINCFCSEECKRLFKQNRLGVDIEVGGEG